jgi:hypothetical protein
VAGVPAVRLAGRRVVAARVACAVEFRRARAQLVGVVPVGPLGRMDAQAYTLVDQLVLGH